MRTFHGIDELRAALGTHLGHSEWKRVSAEDVDAFATLTGDRQWIHVDAERAAAGPFGTRIAHGFLTVSHVPLFMNDVLDIRGVGMLVNYGSDRVRFLSPVPTGSRLRGGVELTSLTHMASGHRLGARVTIEIEGAHKPACVADTITLIVT
ncbi:MAG TPA: MaoC family dehydratase [Jiangellaceae bacterium]